MDGLDNAFSIGKALWGKHIKRVSAMIPRMTLLAVLLAAPMAAMANQPVAQLDLARYAGNWHEIAHLPMFFQRKCADRITATYSPLPTGNIKVVNACRTREGEAMQSSGEARKVAGKPGALQVRFAPAWLSWVPMVWADYWVIDLDPEYGWAVVGGPSRKYLWVLSRTPTMSGALFASIKACARDRGYPVDKLVMAAPLTP